MGFRLLHDHGFQLLHVAGDGPLSIEHAYQVGG